VARRLIPAFLALILLVIPATPALAQAQGMMASVGIRLDPTYGQILTDSSGKTLYTNNGDPSMASTCTGTCASAWPPLTIDPSMMAGMDMSSMGMMMSGPLGTITRDDGSTQVTWDGKPLYYFVRDQQPGDVNGNGAGATFGGFSVVALSGM